MVRQRFRGGDIWCKGETDTAIHSSAITTHLQSMDSNLESAYMFTQWPNVTSSLSNLSPTMLSRQYRPAVFLRWLSDTTTPWFMWMRVGKQMLLENTVTTASSKFTLAWTLWHRLWGNTVTRARWFKVLLKWVRSGASLCRLMSLWWSGLGRAEVGGAVGSDNLFPNICPWTWRRVEIWYSVVWSCVTCFSIGVWTMNS